MILIESAPLACYTFVKFISFDDENVVYHYTDIINYRKKVKINVENTVKQGTKAKWYFVIFG